MDMSGEYRIPAPRERVWDALNDPEVLKQAIPGCEDLKRVSDNELEAAVRSKIGPVSAKFTGKVTLSELNPPESYRISGEGKGGAAGFARGGANVTLAADGEAATVLRYTANAEVGGKLAQIGSRLVQGSAKKMADDFFSKFAQIVGGAPAEGGTAAAGEAAGPAAAATTATPAATPAAAPISAPPIAPPPAAPAGPGDIGGTARPGDIGGTARPGDNGGAARADDGMGLGRVEADDIGTEFPGTVGGPHPAIDPGTRRPASANASTDRAPEAAPAPATPGMEPVRTTTTSPTGEPPVVQASHSGASAADRAVAGPALEQPAGAAASGPAGQTPHSATPTGARPMGTPEKSWMQRPVVWIGGAVLILVLILLLT
jgi:uncharacterized protein